MFISQSDTVSPSSDEMIDTKQLQDDYSQLRQTNEKLILELNSLRTQFNEATSISTQLEQIHSKNTELSSNLRKVTAEKEELSQRLELNIQMIDELRKSKEQEKTEMERRIQQEIGEVRETLENDKKQSAELLSKAQSDLKETQRQLKTAQDENEILLNSIKEVVESAQSYFLQPFKNLDQLQLFLSQNKPTEKQSKGNSESNAKQRPNEFDVLKKKYKSLKQTAKGQYKTIQGKDQQISQLEKDINELKNTLEVEKDKYQEQLNEFERKIQNSEDQRKLMITSYDNKISELNSLLDEERNKTMQHSIQSAIASNQAQDIENLKASLNTTSSKLKEMQSAVFALRKQNSHVISQFSEAENAKEILRRKYQSTTEENEKLRAAIDKLKIENSTITIERDDLKEQNDTILTQMQAAKSSYNQSKSAYTEAECHAEKLRKSIVILENILNKQKEEINDQVLARNRYVDAIHKQNEALNQMESIVSLAQNENRHLKEKLAHHTKPTTPVNDGNNDGIPLTSWFCMDFPRQLCAQISDVANNASLQVTAKLRNVLTTIAKFYNKQIEDLNNMITKTEERINENNEQYNNLLNFLGPFINDQQLTSESFITEPVKKTQLIKSAIEELQNNQIESKLQKTKLQNEVDELLQIIGIETLPTAISSLASMISDYQQTKQQNNSNKSKLKKMTKAMKAMKTAAQQEHDDSHQQIKNQTNEIRKLQDNTRRLQEQNQHNEEIIAQLSSQIQGNSVSLTNNQTRDIEPSAEHSRLKNRTFDNVNARQLQEEIDTQKSHYESLLLAKDQQINELNDRLYSIEKESSQMKKIAELLKNTKNERDQQIQQLMTEHEEKEKETRKKIEHDQQAMQSQFERNTAQFKAKNAELRDLVANVSKALNESEERNKHLLASNSQLSIDNQQLQARFDALNEENKRDKQLAEARVKTMELSFMTQKQMEIEEERSKIESQRRSIYAYVAVQFRPFFDVTTNFLSDEGFKSFVEKCSNELRRLTKTEAALRRLLGLHVNESIEDAVSQILVSIYKQ